MKLKHSPSWIWRGSGAIVAASLILPTLGCGSKGPDTSSAPVSAPAPAPAPASASRPSLGLSNKQKVVLLAGAAALYWYYRKSKKATEAQYAGKTVQYYRSKNGAIYYRDPQNPKIVHWVTPENGTVKPVQVNPDEAQDYSSYAGYPGTQGGQTTFPLQ